MRTWESRNTGKTRETGEAGKAGESRNRNIINTQSAYFVTVVSLILLQSHVLSTATWHSFMCFVVQNMWKKQKLKV